MSRQHCCEVPSHTLPVSESQHCSLVVQPNLASTWLGRQARQAPCGASNASFSQAGTAAQHWLGSSHTASSALHSGLRWARGRRAWARQSTTACILRVWLVLQARRGLEQTARRAETTPSSQALSVGAGVTVVPIAAVLRGLASKLLVLDALRARRDGWREGAAGSVLTTGATASAPEQCGGGLGTEATAASGGPHLKAKADRVDGVTPLALRRIDAALGL